MWYKVEFAMNIHTTFAIHLQDPVQWVHKSVPFNKNVCEISGKKPALTKVKL